MDMMGQARKKHAAVHVGGGKKRAQGRDQVMRLWGNSYHLWGNSYHLWGNLYPLWGNLYPLWGNLYPLWGNLYPCLLYTSPSPRDGLLSRMPSSA